MKNFIKFRLKSFKYASRGMVLLIRTEHSIIAQTSLFLMIICMGIFFGISKQDWINQFLAMGLVLATEGINTAVEKLADFVHIEQHPKIGFIKDIAAGAVAFAALFGLIIFIIIYVPYFKVYV